MKNISIKKFGKDHWSLLAYIETRCVDYKGILDVAHLRIKNPAIGMGSYHAPYNRPDWKPEWGTRLKGYFLPSLDKDGKKNEVINSRRRLDDHDDLDCADDLERVGYLKNIGTGLNPAYNMTKLGNQVASLLREHKTNGGQFANFEI